jgi:branched-chain amino acid aminotransferase
MTAALFNALDAGYDTTVLRDTDGYITEGPGFNIFAVIDGKVLTPRSGMLEGISRKTVLEICVDLGIPCAETDISLDEFLSADEIFTATTAGGPVPVTRVNTTILGNDTAGPLTAQILQTYWDWHNRADLIEKVPYV